MDIEVGFNDRQWKVMFSGEWLIALDHPPDEEDNGTYCFMRRKVAPID